MAYVLRDDKARDDDLPASARPRRRTRHQGRRPRTVRFALTDAEYAEVSAAARQAGLARGAYAAEATLATARGEIATPDAPLADAVHALDRAALGVRRIGVNLNQAVAKLNATGQPSGDLPRYAQESIRRAARLEEAGKTCGSDSCAPSAHPDHPGHADGRPDQNPPAIPPTRNDTTASRTSPRRCGRHSARAGQERTAFHVARNAADGIPPARDVTGDR
ncbi:MAG: hypothetical protein ABSB76_02230 [Streptosporangiaceae bacterium]